MREKEGDADFEGILQDRRLLIGKGRIVERFSHQSHLKRVKKRSEKKG